MDEHHINFFAAIEKRDPAAVLGTYADVLKTLKVTLAMNASAECGARVACDGSAFKRYAAQG